jgi:hypothetical protein
MEEGGRCEGLRRVRRACTTDGAEGAEVCGSGSGHRGHTSVLAATSTCSERGTSDGLSSGLSSGLTWRRTALRGASAGLRQSACATSASRSTAARNIATRQALSLRTNTAPWQNHSQKKPHARVAKAGKKTYNSPFASAELDILRRRFTFSFVGLTQHAPRSLAHRFRLHAGRFALARPLDGVGAGAGRHGRCAQEDRGRRHRHRPRRRRVARAGSTSTSSIITTTIASSTTAATTTTIKTDCSLTRVPPTVHHHSWSRARRRCRSRGWTSRWRRSRRPRPTPTVSASRGCSATRRRAAASRASARCMRTQHRTA